MQYYPKVSLRRNYTRKSSRKPKHSVDLVVSTGRIIYRKENKKLCFGVLPPIGRKEVGKAERFRKIHEKRYESNIT